MFDFMPLWPEAGPGIAFLIGVITPIIVFGILCLFDKVKNIQMSTNTKLIVAIIMALILDTLMFMNPETVF